MLRLHLRVELHVALAGQVDFLFGVASVEDQFNAVVELGPSLVQRHIPVAVIRHGCVHFSVARLTGWLPHLDYSPSYVLCSNLRLSSLILVVH